MLKNFIHFYKEVVNLGVVLDSHLTMQEHIMVLTKSCSFQLRQLVQVRRSLDKGTLECLVHAFVHSRLDYCNSLLYGVSNKSLSMLQSIQNRAARLVSGVTKFEHVTPIFRDLHWLPIDRRIRFKVALLMFKCINGRAPKYLIDKCLPKTSCSQLYQLRSNSLNFYIVPPTNLVIGSRSFGVFGPVVWNSLPGHLRQPGLSLALFKKQLKTHLFPY